MRVVTIAPGTFDTPMLAQLPDEAQAGLASVIPFPHRLGNPEEFAALVEHIVGNTYLNGETIRLDGAPACHRGDRSPTSTTASSSRPAALECQPSGCSPNGADLFLPSAEIVDLWERSA